MGSRSLPHASWERRCAAWPAPRQASCLGQWLSEHVQSSAVAFVRPNGSEKRGLPGDKTRVAFDLPPEFRNANVLIEVEDNGPGIPDDVLPQIFEPFFTTKDVGEGTGLGLAIAYGIVQEHDGWIDVHSRAGEGTC